MQDLIRGAAEAMNQFFAGNKADLKRVEAILRETLSPMVLDALRWDYVRSLGQIQSVKMDSQHSWRWIPLHYGRGPTIDDAVDAEVAFLAAKRGDAT
jgi:hypothetical protein